jgi:MoaA/NifB/PqqE/SkfB family radical SAM enzyme
MNIPHERFCILPWVSLETSPIGTVRPCCLSINEIVNDAGEKFQLKSASFDQIRSSRHMQQLRQQFLAGEQPQDCRRCWLEERSGRTSKRMHTLDRLKHMGISDSEWTEDAKPLMFLDLKLGNICNLKCRICGSWSSSTFATEEIQFIIGPEAKKASYHYQMLRDGAWPRENEVFWRELAHSAAEIRYIEFTGGEPFMIREHFDLLKELVERGLASRIEIHYNTNGTQWPGEAADIWRHFKLVEIAFSIDDVGTRFEYQRSNARWAEVQENILRFYQLRDQHANIRLQVCTTVSAFNVLYLADVAAWVDQQQFDFVYWNMLHDPYYFGIANLPERAKTLATERLQAHQFSDQNQPEITRIIEFMQAGPTIDPKMIGIKARDLDRKRSENLRDIMPELADAIDYDAT